MELDPKISGSVTAFVVGLVLRLGFEPNVEQNVATQDAIRYLLALMPAGCYLIGAVLLPGTPSTSKSISGSSGA